MAFTKKIAGWVAGRIKGEQARKDTMRWMEKTGLGQVLDIAGDIALTQGALKGAGKLKGLLTGGGKVAAPVAAKALPEGVTEVGRMASANPAESRAMAAQLTGGGLKPLPAPGAGTTTFAPRAATAVTPPGLPATGLPTPPPMAAIGARPMTPIAPPAAPATMPRPLGTTPIPPRVATAVTPPTAPAAMPQPIRMATAPTSPGPAQALMTGTIPEPTMPMRPMSAPGAGTTTMASRVAGGITPPTTAPGLTPTTIPSAEPSRLGQMLGATAKFGRENAGWIAPAATAITGILGQRAEQAVEEQKLAQQGQQWQKTFDVNEEERRRLREQQNRLAALFMPRSA